MPIGESEEKRIDHLPVEAGAVGLVNVAVKEVIVEIVRILGQPALLLNEVEKQQPIQEHLGVIICIVGQVGQCGDLASDAVEDPGKATKELTGDRFYVERLVVALLDREWSRDCSVTAEGAHSLLLARAPFS